MNKKVKITLFALLPIILIGSFAYNYVLYGGTRNLANEKTDFTVTSSSITSEFTTDIDASNKKYLENAVAVKGKVTACNGKQVILDETIICNFKNEDLSIKKGQLITVKGRIIGYDDLMGELKLDQCFVIKN